MNLCAYDWNSLSNDTKHINTIKAFKSKYKNVNFTNMLPKKCDCYRVLKKRNSCLKTDHLHLVFFLFLEQMLTLAL